MNAATLALFSLACALQSPQGQSGAVAQGGAAQASAQKPAAGATSSVPLTPQQKADAQQAADLKFDKEEGAQYAAQVAKENKLVASGPQLDRVRKIGAILQQVANKYPAKALWGDKRLNQLDYTFNIIDADEINAFSLPGGYVYIYRGLLDTIESDDELAGVLGHEMSHAKFRHIATLRKEAQHVMYTQQLPLLVAALLTGGAAAAGGAIGVGSLLGQAQQSGWSQQAEMAADYGGFQILTHTQYDPTGMITVMERFMQMERANPLMQILGIWRDHPPSPERDKALISYMNAAGMPVRRSRVCTSMAASAVPQADGTVQLSFGKRKLVIFGGANAGDRANLAVHRLNDFFDGEPELYDLANSRDGSFFGKHQMLFSITQDDAAASKTSVRMLENQALQNLKDALYDVSYRVWDE